MPQSNTLAITPWGLPPIIFVCIHVTLTQQKWHIIANFFITAEFWLWNLVLKMKSKFFVALFLSGTVPGKKHRKEMILI